MSKIEIARQIRQSDTLLALGFTRQDADQLRRISLTLRSWFTLECGTSNDYGAWAIERDETTEIAYRVYHSYGRNGAPTRTVRTRIPDRETGARVRLDALIARVNRALFEQSGPVPDRTVSAYVQTDPRGCALYILRPGDVPEGGDPSAYYSRGLAIY